jgi:hypothetical protein
MEMAIEARRKPAPPYNGCCGPDVDKHKPNVVSPPRLGDHLVTRPQALHDLPLPEHGAELRWDGPAVLPHVAAPDETDHVIEHSLVPPSCSRGAACYAERAVV